MRRYRLLIPLLLAALFSACSSKSNAPSEAEARAVVEQDIKDLSQGCIRLLDCRKGGEVVLESMMVVNVSATIEFLEDCYWPTDQTVAVQKIAPGVTPNAKKGEQRTISLILYFQKSGRGWKAVE